MIRILGLATAEPDFMLRQDAALEFCMKHFPQREGARRLYQKVFANESVRSRRFCVASPEDFLEDDLDAIHRRFEAAAVQLSAQALERALAQAGVAANRLDFLAACTCTGYLCPGLASRLIEPCGLRNDLRYIEAVGMGCGAAIPAIEQCHNFLRANPGATAAAVATEICSAAFCRGDEPDLIISNAIFADGSAACVLGEADAGGGAGSVAGICGFGALTRPEERDALRFRTEKGRLRNVLSPKVPALAGQAVRQLVDPFLARLKTDRSAIRHWVIHSGGQKVLDEIRRALELPESTLALSRENLARRGNLSSPSVLFALDDLLHGSAPPASGERGLLIAFGAGFSAHVSLIEF